MHQLKVTSNTSAIAVYTNKPVKELGCGRKPKGSLPIFIRNFLKLICIFQQFQLFPSSKLSPDIVNNSLAV